MVEVKDLVQETMAIFAEARRVALLDPEIRAEMRKGLKIVRKIRDQSIALKKAAKLDENKITAKELTKIQFDLKSRITELDRLVNEWRILKEFPGHDDIQVKLDTGMFQIREEFQKNWPIFEEKVRANA